MLKTKLITNGIDIAYHKTDLRQKAPRVKNQFLRLHLDGTAATMPRVRLQTFLLYFCVLTG